MRARAHVRGNRGAGTQWCRPKRILPATSRAAAARRALLNPANLIPFPVLAVLALARHYHFIADEPLWLILGAMLLTQLVTTTIAVVFPPGTTDARPRLLLTAQIVLTGLCVYTNGWGSLLAVGFVFAAASAIHADGSRYAVWAMVLTVLTVAAGETTVALGWLKSMVPQPEGHGLALLEVAGTCAVIWILAYNQKEKERVESSLRRSERRFRALVQHASDIIMVVAADGSLAYASPAFEGILGYPPGEAVGHGGALAHEARRRVALPPARRGDPRGRERRARRADAAPPRRHVALVRVDLHQPLRRSRDRRLGREPARHHRAPAVRRRAAAGAGGLPPRVRRGGHRHDARRSGRSHHPFERRDGADAALPGPRLPGRRPTGRDHAPRRRARGRRGPAGHRRRRQRRLPHRDPARRAPTARRCGSR